MMMSGDDCVAGLKAVSALPGHNRACRHQASRAVGVIHEDDDIPFGSPKGTMSLLCTWGVCRSRSDNIDRSREPYVKVHLKASTSQQECFAQAPPCETEAATAICRRRSYRSSLCRIYVQALLCQPCLT